MDRNVFGFGAKLVHSVALRKESVDRNLVSGVNRAINIVVALRKESVDRNTACRICGQHVIGRSPQGERG